MSHPVSLWPSQVQKKICQLCVKMGKIIQKIRKHFFVFGLKHNILGYDLLEDMQVTGTLNIALQSPFQIF